MQVKSITDVSEKDRDMVDNFSKDTGDFASLSAVDRLVIALGVKISREKGEFDKVNKEPKPLSEFRPKSFKPYYEDGESSSSSEDEPKKEQDTFDDGFAVTSGPKRGAAHNRAFDKYKAKIEAE